MIQNTRIALAPYQAKIPISSHQTMFSLFLVWSIGIKSTFCFYKKLLVGQGWDLHAIWILFRKSKPFWYRLLVFRCGFRFFLESFSFDLRFFPIHRSWKYRIIQFLWFHLKICVPAWPLAFKKSSCCEKWFRDSAAGPILPDLAGFFNYHDGPALLSFLVAALPVTLNRLPRVSWPWFVFLGVSIIYHTKTPVYIGRVDILMMYYLYIWCIENWCGLVL